MKQFWSRFWASTPTYFNNIAKAGAGAVAIGIGAATIPGIPESVTHVTSHFIWAGGLAALIAKQVVKNPEDIKKG